MAKSPLPRDHLPARRPRHQSAPQCNWSGGTSRIFTNEWHACLGLYRIRFSGHQHFLWCSSKGNWQHHYDANSIKHGFCTYAWTYHLLRSLLILFRGLHPLHQCKPGMEVTFPQHISGTLVLVCDSFIDLRAIICRYIRGSATEAFVTPGLHFARQ